MKLKRSHGLYLLMFLGFGVAMGCGLFGGGSKKPSGSRPPADKSDGGEEDSAGEDSGTEDTAGTSPEDVTATRFVPESCKVQGGFETGGDIEFSRVFTSASVQEPVDLLFHGDNAYITSRQGRIFQTDSLAVGSGVTSWLDIADRTDSGPGECGTLSLAFHPDNTKIYVFYCRNQGQLQTVVSEFQLGANNTPDPNSERILLAVDQPYGNHNGGQLAFGPDGYLYISLGDGGSANDPLNHGQNPNTLLGTILRIDVDTTGGGLQYGIPSDNPFVGQPGRREEIWAWGLRNVWRFSFDVDGTLWAADVGQDAQEEIDIILRGRNYGWKTMEGTICRPPTSDCDETNLELPVLTYGRDDGVSITGGFVYRGERLPWLTGSYVFGDFESRRIWQLYIDSDGTYKKRLLGTAPDQVSTFGIDSDGEIYLAGIGNGRIYQIVPAQGSPDTEPSWPAKLSETGCFRNLPSMEPIPGVVPYEVNHAFYSDGAQKKRWLVVHGTDRMGYAAEGAWTLPQGSVAIKHFEFGGKKLETRFIVNSASGYSYATYKWNDAGNDAVLLSGSSQSDLGSGKQWYFPGPIECRSCHNDAAGSILGITTQQMSGQSNMHTEQNATNQIDWLIKAGYMQNADGVDATGLPALSTIDQGEVSLAERARDYLHVNCSTCHQPDANAQATMDLRRTTALTATETCNEEPNQGDLGITGARIILPGDPDRSILYRRMISTDESVKMPAVSSGGVDQPGVGLIRDWISSLAGCSDL